ncbi:hypothetical protein [Sphingobacterium pedocola]|uniref:Lipocalin-like domain-containing protein n=1 Tax=Sphingobacterium pedocola TaxID=2082722 RepID=A0ABR9T6Y3_9SPHI|nr:hypothetical protein [Sphingobacterium pedocola]MBE8721086.1 hypothetical protein [Sphingobacterium pedocola]
MLHFKRKRLLAITYILLVSLLITAAYIVMHFENPERLIQGEWVETGWYLEKTDGAVQHSEWKLQNSLRAEIMKDLEFFNVEVWKFDKDGTIKAANNSLNERIEWYIRGRGHILQLVREGKQLESFQIANIDRNTLELHLNLDLQVRGVLKIKLERKGYEEKYAKKI